MARLQTRTNRTKPSKSVPDPEARLRSNLLTGLADLSIELKPAQHQQLIDYLLLLSRWNKKTNLTAVRDIDEMVGRHLLDSLSTLAVVSSVLKHYGSRRLLDVGSGAGLPGIPLAISAPDLEVTMLDSASRKTRFIRQAIAELGLENASVVTERVQNADLTPFPCVVARAFSTPVDIIETSHHLCASDGAFLLMMGHVENKLEQLPHGFVCQQLEQVHLPDDPATRHLAVCKRGG